MLSYPGIATSEFRIGFRKLGASGTKSLPGSGKRSGSGST